MNPSVPTDRSANERHEVYLCGTPFEGRLKSGELTALDLAPIAARLGTEGVEYRTGYWTDRESELPRVVAQLDELGLSCTYASFATLNASEPAELMRDIDDARALGARLLRVFRGGEPDAVSSASAHRVIDYATEKGVRLALENFVGLPGNLLAEIVATLDEHETPALGVNIDIGNYAKNRQDPIEAIEALGGRIVYCHFKDIRETADGPVVAAPGDGGLDLDGVLAALDRSGSPAVPFGFEYAGADDPDDAVRKGLRFLESRGRRA